MSPLPDQPTGELRLGGPPEEDKTLEFYVKKRGENKRDYVFSLSKSRTCPHNELKAMVTGGTKYYCTACNWASDIPWGYGQPLHNVVVGSLLQVMHFAKEFGADALQEVLRTPKGQHELDYHLPALPEGMNFWDAIDVLEQVDVNLPDRGAGTLRKLFEEHWVSIEERERRHKELKTASPALGALLEQKGLLAVESEEYPEAIGHAEDSEKLGEGRRRVTKFSGNGRGEEKQAAVGGGNMPSLSAAKEPHPESGDSRES